MTSKELVNAIKIKDFETCKKLLEKGYSTKSKILFWRINETPLIMALETNSYDLVSLFLEYCDINEVSYKLTALQKACYDNSLEIINLLLENGANINYYNNTYSSPLGIAAITQRIKLIHLLLNKGADINYLWNKCHWIGFHKNVLNVLISFSRENKQNVPKNIIQYYELKQDLFPHQ